MDKQSRELGRVSFVLTEEQRVLLLKEAMENHAGNMSHLFRRILNDRYKLDKTVKRQGDKRA